MRHLGLDRAAGVLLEVDVPGLAQADHHEVVPALLEAADDVLLPLAVELPAEPAGAGLAVGQGVALPVAPVAAAAFEHPAQRVAVAHRAQPLGLGVGAPQQPADHLVVDADERRRVLGDQVGDRERVLAAVEPAAQPARPEGAHGHRQHRGRVAPQALRRLQDVEDAVVAVARMAVGQCPRGMIDGGDPGLELAVDGGADLVGLGCCRRLERRQQRRRRVLAFGVDEAGAGAREADPAAAAVHDVDARDVRRAALALHPARDRSSIALDVDLHDRALLTQRFGLVPGRQRKEPFQVAPCEGKHWGSFCFSGCCYRR
jgi:hypothetical protein